MGAVKEFVQLYTANCEKSWELDEALMQEKSFPEWRDVLIERSVTIRDFFRKNEDSFQEVVKLLKETKMTAELAEEIYDALEEMYYGGYDDLYVMETMAAPILEYYGEKNDIERLIFLYHMLAFENFEFYERVLGEREASETVAYFYKVISWKDHYGQIKNPRIRKCFFTAYNNLIAPVGQVVSDIKGRVFDIYEEVMELWESETVQKLDGQNEDFLDCIRQIREDILFTEDYVLEMPKEFQEKFVQTVEKMQKYNRENDISDGEGTMLRAGIKCRILAGDDPKILIGDLLGHIGSLTLPDFGGEEWECMLRILDYHNSAASMFDLFVYGKIPEEEQPRYMERFVPLVTNLHLRIPFGFWTTVMSNLCAEWYKETAPYLKNIEEKRTLLRKLIISRQPITYIHSLMVSEIAVRIAATLLREKPFFFIGILDCENEEQVRANHDRLLAYVSECALMHDVGKCELSEVINRQSRRLSDNEFSMIKCHPRSAQKLLGTDALFAPYFDIMLGHHRSYDGKRGYPEDFDNTASPIKPLIDLIMIADCTDAATDTLGRNYTKGKNFKILFEELSEGAGSMYNPQIVDAIARSESLFRDLEYLTEHGRQEIYYRAYKEIITR